MIAYLCFSKNGVKLGQNLQEIFGGDLFYSGEYSIKNNMREIWNNYEVILFISATGIAVRFIAPYLVKKDQDPAVLVMDDLGRYVISLLSGHLGGANQWANQISKNTGAIAIITTATDGRGLEGLDLYAKRMGFYIEDLKKLTPFTGMMVNGEKIHVYNPNHYLLPDYTNWEQVSEHSKKKNVLAITEEIIDFQGKVAFLRPKNLHLGVGARRNVEVGVLTDVILKTFHMLELSVHSIADIATITLKQEEPTILHAAKAFNVPLLIYDIDELRAYDDLFKGSDFVKKTVGIRSVSATCAYKSAKNIIAEKIQERGITLSISKEE